MQWMAGESGVNEPSNLSLGGSILITIEAQPFSTCLPGRTNGFYLQETTSLTKLVLFLVPRSSNLG